MKAYRLASPRYDPREGWGAFKWGGRWNSPGCRAIYTASSLAFTCLEVLVHLQDTTNIPMYAYWELTILDRVIGKWERANDGVLATESGTVGLGDMWLGQVPKGPGPSPLELTRVQISRSPRIDRMRLGLSVLFRFPREPRPVLQVPSFIIPQEWNYVIAPEHFAFKEIEWSEPKPFTFDRRFFHGTR